MAADIAEIREFIRTSNRGSTIPAMLAKILALAGNESSSPEELCELITFDQSLAEMVLRTANSAMFGYSGRIRDIEQAVMFLGYKKIRSIAVGMNVFKMFPSDSAKIKDLWVHGYTVAFIANGLADKVSMISSKETFLSGLLHDIGRIIFYQKDPETFSSMELTRNILEDERAAFGCTHEQVGSWYVEETGLPGEVAMPILYHHRPDSAPEFSDAVAIVSLADALSLRLNPKVEGDGTWGPEHDDILNRFSLTEGDIIAVAEALGGIQKELEAFFG
jgi:HD-like signal output (HDOD) protein